MKVLLNIIRAQGMTLINICQEELLGKVFRDGEIILDISEKFYGGDSVELDYAFSLIDEATVMSIVGNYVVEEAIKRGLVHKDSVISVAGIKFAQVYNV
ncbi:DUF424 family protein [Sulfolobus sp. E5-1-F]|uniref:DUF424 domain-containing protein n=1 Tax=Sulfolobaceae TaxID=118883 RepID=UPI0012970420|nr:MULTISPECIES: DUF424 domain-containing protein [unclassified Sulfolobus]QGA53527.1 DUF424 family protein [Sulfolobus sp. E5-1-F]QGA68805.1 DUF424 family protein [Sulfolobus sp. E11-6]